MHVPAILIIFIYKKKIAFPACVSIPVTYFIVQLKRSKISQVQSSERIIVNKSVRTTVNYKGITRNIIAYVTKNILLPVKIGFHQRN